MDTVYVVVHDGSLCVHSPNLAMVPDTVDGGAHHLHSVFVWVPESTHVQGLLDDGRAAALSALLGGDFCFAKGWTPKLTRGAVVRDDCLELLYRRGARSARRPARRSLMKASLFLFVSCATLWFDDETADSLILARVAVLSAAHTPSRTCRS